MAIPDKVVVVGAGVGGLAAATRLAEAGAAVTVLEPSRQPGGLAGGFEGGGNVCGEVLPSPFPQ